MMYCNFERKQSDLACNNVVDAVCQHREHQALLSDPIQRSAVEEALEEPVLVRIEKLGEDARRIILEGAMDFGAISL